MTITTLTSQELAQDFDRAKLATQSGPVLMADPGEPTYVLLRHEVYLQIVGKGPSIRELLDMPGTEDIEFDPPRMGRIILQVPDLD